MVKQKRMKRTNSAASYGAPKYPYSSTPGSLNRFLGMVPDKPRPEKINFSTLKAWGFKNSNDQSIIRVLKALDLVSPAGEPTKNYEEFMQQVKGPAVLGRQIRKVYSSLFTTVANPGSASSEELKNFFNTYGGGSEKVVQLQIQTFKAMVGHATFGSSDPLEQRDGNKDIDPGQGFDMPAIRIDLHIHLPENKTKAEYDSILESIAKHLYGKKV